MGEDGSALYISTVNLKEADMWMILKNKILRLIYGSKRDRIGNGKIFNIIYVWMITCRKFGFSWHIAAIGKISKFLR